MAKQFLNFFKGANVPSTAVIGSVWFDTTNRLIKVKVADSGDKMWEAYSGLQNASWDEGKKQLVLTKADGTTFGVDLSDVASATALGLLADRVTEVETWKGTTTTDVNNLKTDVNTLKGEMDAVEAKAAANEGKLAGLTKDTVMAEIEAQVKVEADRAKGVEDGLASRVGDLETASGTHGEDIDDLKETVQGIQDNIGGQIDAKINALNATVGSTTVESNKHVAVQVVETAGKLTGLTVTESDIASAQGLADEITRAKGIEAEINEKIGGSFSKTSTVATAIQAAADAAAAAQADIDAFLKDADMTEKAVDTLKELQTYIEEHGEVAAGMLDDIAANQTAIADLTPRVGDLETGLSDLIGEIEKNEETIAAAYNDVNSRLGVIEGVVDDTTKTISAQIADAVNPVSQNVSDLQTAVNTINNTTIPAKVQELQQYADGKVKTLADGAVATNTAGVAANAKAIEDLDKAVVKSVSGSTYITVSEGQNPVVSANVASSVSTEDKLVTASAVKAYVDDLWMWADFA